MSFAAPAVAAAFERVAERIESLSARVLAPVTLSPALLERTGASRANRPDRVSANGSCRLLRARDGWVALNLPREEDLALVPALLGATPDEATWDAIARGAARSGAAAFVSRARLLGLAAARLGETPSPRVAPAIERLRGDARPWSRPPRVVDLSALWAGPLASALLARAGCDVVKVDGRAQPDRFGAQPRPGIGRLDAGKRHVHLRLDDDDGRARLVALLETADVVITGMRPRALAALGLEPTHWLRRRPALVWIAITAHGLRGRTAQRIGFGDDCAVAGGLVDLQSGDGPRFLGDALADPLTGLAGAAHAFDALARRRGGLHDVSLAGTAAAIARPAQRTPALHRC